MRKTNAARIVDRAGIDYELRTYELSIEDFSASAVASQIGLSPGTVFKTLVATVGSEPCFAVVPADRDLDLRALARAAGTKRAAMVPMKDVESITGYQRGAVTVLGARKALSTYLDESARTLPRIAVSAGARGLQMLLKPGDYQNLTGARLAPIAERPVPESLETRLA